MEMSWAKVSVLVLSALLIGDGGGFAFGAQQGVQQGGSQQQSGGKKVIYPKKTELSFEGTDIQGELRNPGEFYFQRREEEKFDSLVKRRKNFHRELLRDAVLSK